MNKDGTDRWPLLAEHLGQAEPDALLLNEALGWTDKSEYLLKRAENDLGMTALRPLPPSRSELAHRSSRTVPRASVVP